MLAGMLSGGVVPRHAGCANPPPSTSSSGGGGLACVQPWVTPWGLEIRRLWATWCCRMLARLWAWARAVRFYLRLCGVGLCTTSRGLRSLQWNRRTRAHRLFLGMLAVVWWRTSRKSRASPPLPLTTPSRAHPRPSRDLYQSHDKPSLPRPAPSPLLLTCRLKSSSCPILTRMRMLEMGREFVGLWSVCQIWGVLLLRQMPSGLGRPALGGWSPVSDPGNRCPGGSSAPPPPLSGSTVCLPRPGWVAPMRLSRPFGSSALCPRGGFPKLRSARPVSDPRLVRDLPPVVGFPLPQVGVGGGGALAPGLRDVPRPPTGSVGGAGASAHERLSAVAVGCEASNPAPPASPRASGGGRARMWAVRKLVEGGGRWSWRWRLAGAVEQPSEQAVDVGRPPRGVGASYAWRPLRGDVRDSGRVAGTWDSGLGARRGSGCLRGGVGGGLPPWPT